MRPAAARRRGIAGPWSEVQRPRPGSPELRTGVVSAHGLGALPGRIDRPPAAVLYRAPSAWTRSPCGGTGRRARLKIEFRKECWFDSGQGHQYLTSQRRRAAFLYCKIIALRRIPRSRAALEYGSSRPPFSDHSMAAYFCDFTVADALRVRAAAVIGVPLERRARSSIPRRSPLRPQRPRPHLWRRPPCRRSLRPAPF